MGRLWEFETWNWDTELECVRSDRMIESIQQWPHYDVTAKR